MAELPALFNGGMVGALLAGTKKQTRRANHLERLRRFGPVTEFGRSDTRGYDWHFRDRDKRWHDLRHAELLSRLPWRVGDRLYVRETCAAVEAWDGTDIVRFDADAATIPIENTPEAATRWVEMHHYRRKRGASVPSIHMPRWASRITLTVTDVRVERLQEISEADAIADGVGLERYVSVSDSAGLHSSGDAEPTDPIEEYRDLWNSLNGPGSWDANPWVAAYTFTVALGNIDQIGRAA